MTSYSFSPVNWGGQQPGTSGTSHIQNTASRQRAVARTVVSRPQAANHVELIGPSFETVNTFLAAVIDGDQQALTALGAYPGSAASRAVGTGRLAGHRR
jgi:hypothetical protein